jgi:hypothetical protein
MKKLEYILYSEWLSFYQLICLLKSYKINPHEEFRMSLLNVICISLRNKLDERDTKNIRRNLL